MYISSAILIFFFKSAVCNECLLMRSIDMSFRYSGCTSNSSCFNHLFDSPKEKVIFWHLKSIKILTQKHNIKSLTGKIKKQTVALKNFSNFLTLKKDQMHQHKRKFWHKKKLWLIIKETPSSLLLQKKKEKPQTSFNL